MANTVITSFTKEGYDLYGKDCIESFKKHWPESVKLAVYAEGIAYEHEWLSVDMVPGLWEFMTAIKPFPLMSGDVGGKYNINYDARMARKSFMLRHALKTF